MAFRASTDLVEVREIPNVLDEATDDFAESLMGTGEGDGEQEGGLMGGGDSADDILNTPVVPEEWQPIKDKASGNVYFWCVLWFGAGSQRKCHG